MYCDSLPDYEREIKETAQEKERILNRMTVGKQMKAEGINSLSRFFEHDPIKKVVQANDTIKIQLKSGDSLYLKDASLTETEQDLVNSFVYEFELHEAGDKY